MFRRLDRLDEALAAYAAALARAPEDEGAMRGRAELHAEAGRRSDAAADYEALAGVAERAGRLTDACDAARRALELAESRSRRREMERLGALLRERGEDRPAVDALDRALRILEAVETLAPASDATEAAGGPAPAPDEPAIDPGPVESEIPGGQGRVTPGSGGPAGRRRRPPRQWRPGAAGERYLALAALHRAAGRHDAAMDACLALLVVTPSEPRLQLAIAAIQADQGWSGVAAEKLRLLARLADLDGDAATQGVIATFAAELGLEPAPQPAPGT